MNKKSILGLSTALLSCASTNADINVQDGSNSQAIVKDTRSELEQALAKWHTNKTGIQNGEKPEYVYSIACTEAGIRFSANAAQSISLSKARNALNLYACPELGAPGNHSSLIPAAEVDENIVNRTVCVRIATVKKVVCDGQTVDVKKP